MAAYGVVMTASGVIKPMGGKVHRVIVASTNAGTYVLYDNAKGDTSGVAKTGTITPAANTWIDFAEMTFKDGISITVGGSALNVTVVYE